jgi:hypothetical protein
LECDGSMVYDRVAVVEVVVMKLLRCGKQSGIRRGMRGPRPSAQRNRDDRQDPGEIFP